MKTGPAARDEGGLFRHGSLLMIGTLVGSLCNAGFHMVMGRPQVLSNAEYGSLVAMLGVILAVSTPLLALQNTLAHFISKLVADDRRDEVMTLFLHWVELFAAASAVLVAGAWMFRGPLAAFWGGVDPRLIVATFTVLAGSLWMYLFYGLLQGMQAFGWLAAAPQLWGLVRLVLGAALAIWVSGTALAAITAQGAGVVLVLACCAWAVHTLRLPPRRAVKRPAGTYRYLGSALVCLGGYAALMNLDTALAKHYFDAETAGIFAKAATIARTGVFLPVPIAMALFPKVTSSGEMSDASWRLLLRALAYGGLILGGVVGGCLLFPQLPWWILYGGMAPEHAREASALVRAMVLAMAPLALAYLLLNFEMAQRRFRRALVLVPCALLYVGGTAVFHAAPLQIPAVLGTLNAVAAGVLLAGVVLRRRRMVKGVT